jgi:hypothetical protein
MVFDQALGAKGGFEQPAQAGYKNHGDRSSAALRRPPPPPPTGALPAAAASAEAPVAAKTASPYAPGSIIDIKA